MKLISLFMLVIWSFFGMAGVNGVQSCQPVSEVNSADYKFDVILIKKGEKAEIGPIQSLDLSVYRGKIVLLSIFSSKCGWCLADLLYHSSFQKEWPKELSVVMVNLSFGPLPDEMADKRYFDSSPQEMLDFVTTAYKKTRYKERIDLKNVDFYHIVDTPQTKETAFGAIKTFVSSDSNHFVSWINRGLPTVSL